MSTDYTKVSFALFEEDDSEAESGQYGFEVPIDSNPLDGRLWVGYNFDRGSARLYIDLADGNEIHRMPFHPNYTYAILDPVTELAIQRGDDTQFVYFSDGVPMASIADVGGPSEEDHYYTPVYLKKGVLTACSGTTVTSTEQTFSGNKTFNDTLTVKGATSLETTLSVTGSTSLGGVLGVSGVTTLANKLVFSGTTSSTSQIHFDRTNNPSYFTSGNGGYYAFCANGKSAGLTNADLVIKANAVYPGTTQLVSLGTEDNKWDIVYATTFVGALVGNASTANALNTDAGSDTVPVYFANGVPVACSPEKIFSTFERTRTSTKNTVAATICGHDLDFDLTAATASYAGLLTAGSQTIGGAKTFNSNVTIKGTAAFQSIITLDSDSYGSTLPTTGVEGQVFFLLLD